VIPSYISWSCLLHTHASAPLQAVEGPERDESNERRPGVDDDADLEPEMGMSVRRKVTSLPDTYGLSKKGYGTEYKNISSSHPVQVERHVHAPLCLAQYSTHTE
jgi:hypothetical protein